MRVIIDDNAIKELKKIDKNEVKKIVLKIEKLSNYPNIANTKKLTNFYPPYRLRVGNYRVLFDIEDELIIVYSVKHRSKAYK
jgi:mRNA interferase RelE/StbE